MSIKGTIKAKCPEGCEPFESEVWSLVRGDNDKELKEVLLSGELNLLFCPACGKPFYADEPFVYFDPGAEMLAFVFPRSYQKEEEKWRAKMNTDCELLKQGLLKEKQLSFAPQIFFGLEGLKDMLEAENECGDETEIIEVMAGELGLKTVRVSPAYARSSGVPRVIPFSSGVLTRGSAVDGMRKVFSANDRLSRLGGFLKKLESDPACGLPPLTEK